jgi:hypothetical protein
VPLGRPTITVNRVRAWWYATRARVLVSGVCVCVYACVCVRACVCVCVCACACSYHRKDEPIAVVRVLADQVHPVANKQAIQAR